MAAEASPEVIISTFSDMSEADTGDRVRSKSHSELFCKGLNERPGGPNPGGGDENVFDP